MGSELIHANCVSIGGRGVLITGRSGSGKSDLALRLIDRGAVLVSDDYTLVTATGHLLRAAAPATIRGKMEVRGIGIVKLRVVDDVPVALLVDLDGAPERLPDGPDSRTIAGLPVPEIALNGLEASAPLKVELALARFGTNP